MERDVPGFVPNFADAERLQLWDEANPADREVWARIDAHRDAAMIESAAMMLAHAGDRADLPGLMQFLWGFLDKEDGRTFVEAHGVEIADRANEISGAYINPSSESKN